MTRRGTWRSRASEMENRARPEMMSGFFDARSDGYEEHMARTVASFDRFYSSIADPIPETNKALSILDVGCGTGLELDAIFGKALNAVVTGIDLSAGMLGKLREKHANHPGRLHLIQGSYLETPLDQAAYDFIVAVMTLHHLLPARKRALYGRIRAALKRDGAYIEGDWIVSSEEEGRYLSEYGERVRGLGASAEGAYHIDVPLSLETEKRLLMEAGFFTIDVIWRADGNGVYVARG